MLFYHSRCMFVLCVFDRRGINCDGVQTLWKVFRLFQNWLGSKYPAVGVYNKFFLRFVKMIPDPEVGYFRNQEVKGISQERKNKTWREQTDRLMMVDCPVRQRDIHQLLLLMQSIHHCITSQIRNARTAIIYIISTCWLKQYISIFLCLCLW